MVFTSKIKPNYVCPYFIYKSISSFVEFSGHKLVVFRAHATFLTIISIMSTYGANFGE